MTGERPNTRITRRAVIGLAAGGLAAGGTATMPPRTLAADRVIRPDLLAAFGDHAASACFALYEPAVDRLTLAAPERAEARIVPASTFKIANSLIALEVGAVKDENEIIPWGGKPQSIKAWERDMSLREAIAISNVPIYQELARRVGLERYRDWLARLDYGNRDAGTNVERFWLDGPLGISAVEQARFAARLAGAKLQVSARSQAIVRDILAVERAGGHALFAKTGWYAGGSPRIGWWTGWVEHGGAIAAFSLNMEMATAEIGPKRLAIGKAILAKLGHWST